MTLSRTDTSVETATSVSATAVTTSMTLALPDAIATVCASDLRPTSRTPPIASLSTAPKDCPPASRTPLPARAGIHDAGECGVGVCSDCG